MKKTTFYLIALMALMFIGGGAMAQNSGTVPYAGSTHIYTVTKSPSAGALSWSVSGGGVISGTNTSTTVSVLWGATPGTYTVSVTETTTNTCSTQKTFSVTVISNPYNLVVAGPGISCAAGSGTIIPNNATFPGYTQITFTVAASGNAKDSKYDYQLTSSTGADITNVVIDHPVSDGLNLSGANLTLSGGTPLITFTVTVKSRFDIQDLVTLTISNGKDFYGTSENLTSDNIATATINAVPNTSIISAD